LYVANVIDQCSHQLYAIYDAEKLPVNSLQQTLTVGRQFTTTSQALAARHKQPKIRVPSKKALAAKSRRKAAVASKLDEQAEKLSLMDAISVLRVSHNHCRPYIRQSIRNLGH
jgi:hypothetical protein